MKTIRIKKTFVPPEAYGIAAQFQAQANRVRDLASQLRKVKSTLDATWEGNSKNRFSSGYEPEVSKMDNFADWLEDKANQIERITVTVWEEVRVPDDYYA